MTAFSRESNLVSALHWLGYIFRSKERILSQFRSKSIIQSALTKLLFLLNVTNSANSVFINASLEWTADGNGGSRDTRGVKGR